MFPIAFHSFGNLAARQFYMLSHNQSWDTYERVVFISLNARNGDTANGNLARAASVRDVWVDYCLCLGGHAHAQEQY